jgi:hypothetical protein
VFAVPLAPPLALVPYATEPPPLPPPQLALPENAVGPESTTAWLPPPPPALPMPSYQNEPLPPLPGVITSDDV